MLLNTVIRCKSFKKKSNNMNLVNQSCVAFAVAEVKSYSELSISQTRAFMGVLC